MGDPIWLPEVLRAEGLVVNEYPGWRTRGHGDFGEIWGVIVHHTGSNFAPPREIAEHPQLGLCSQLHLSQSGVVTICGAGVAWHAGAGHYPGIPRDNANFLTIGIEAANNGTSGWPDEQYFAYVKMVGAILRKLGRDSSRVIGHKEWAGASQGKWDPGGIDMNVFRRDVQRVILHQPAREAETVATWQEKIKNWMGIDVPAWMMLKSADTYAGLIIDQFLGPGSREREGQPTRWAMLNDNTVVEALAEIGQALKLEGYDPNKKGPAPQKPRSDQR